MKLIEIRRSSGILLIARRGTFPAVMLKASDDQRRDSTIRTLAQDKPAIMQLRAQWQNVFPARAPESFTPNDLVRMVQRELGARSIEAVLLRTPKMPLSPAELANITTGAVNVGTNQRRLLIARKGGLPPEVLPYFSAAEAVAVLGQLRDSDETARQLDRQAGRLYPDGKARLQGVSLRRFLAQQITQGTFDAAVIAQAATAAKVAARPDAEAPVGKMGSLDRIGEALKRSTPYAVKAGGDAIKGAVDAFLQPESIAIMIAIAAGVALANTNPLTGAAVNTTLVLLGWANGGLKAVQGIGAFVLATVQAQNAKTDAELEAAAKAYGEALGAMGPDLLMAIVGRFVPRKGGGGSSGKASVQSSPGPANTGGAKAKPKPSPTRSAPPPQQQRKAPPAQAKPSRPAHVFDDLARKSTRNPDSDTVVLGKFNEGGKSYTKVAAHHKATYFKMENWKETTAGMTDDEIWKINESFLKQQIQQGKNIVLSHDPAKATGFYAREVEFMKALGYKFEQNNWVWKAVRP